MTIRERSVGDVTILDIGGRITVQDGGDVLREALERLILQGQCQLVLDCEHVPYVDTTAISEIVWGYTSLIRRGGSLKLLKLSPHVHQVLFITKLLTVFETFTDEAAAVESFRTASV